MNVAQLRRAGEILCSCLGVKVIPQHEWDSINQVISRLLSSERVPVGASKEVDQVQGIVFSKDRPLQLAATLGSFLEQARGAGPLHVLYAAPAARYQVAYQKIQAEYGAPHVYWHKQGSFRTDLIRVLNSISARSVFFLVDDIVFTEPVDFGELSKFDPHEFIVSLRLGQNLTRCYMASSHQKIPIFTRPATHSPLLSWKWSDGDWDWGYPLSLDGHIFSAAEMRMMASLVDYWAPNSFEGALQIFNGVFRSRAGICYAKSRIVNIPHNKVQKENRNRSQGKSAEELLAAWENGCRMNYQSLYGFHNRSAHEEIPLPLIER